MYLNENNYVRFFAHVRLLQLRNRPLAQQSAFEIYHWPSADSGTIANPSPIVDIWRNLEGLTCFFPGLKILENPEIHRGMQELQSFDVNPDWKAGRKWSLWQLITHAATGVKGNLSFFYYFFIIFRSFINTFFKFAHLFLIRSKLILKSGVMDFCKVFKVLE